MLAALLFPSFLNTTNSKAHIIDRLLHFFLKHTRSFTCFLYYMYFAQNRKTQLETFSFFLAHSLSLSLSLIYRYINIHISNKQERIQIRHNTRFLIFFLGFISFHSNKREDEGDHNNSPDQSSMYYGPREKVDYVQSLCITTLFLLIHNNKTKSVFKGKERSYYKVQQLHIYKLQTWMKTPVDDTPVVVVMV